MSKLLNIRHLLFSWFVLVCFRIIIKILIIPSSSNKTGLWKTTSEICQKLYQSQA
jgi:hypothetical protein